VSENTARKKPFAVMVKDVELARALVELSAEAETLLTSVARPIVLAKGKIELPDVGAGYRRTRRHAAVHAFASS